MTEDSYFITHEDAVSRCPELRDYLTAKVGAGGGVIRVQAFPEVHKSKDGREFVVYGRKRFYLKPVYKS